jgi:2Fe-2S ferredoxin
MVVPKIRFLPSNVNIEIPAELCIREAGIQAGVLIASTCGGVGSCGLCKVKIVAGAEHLTPMTALEVGKLGNVFFITKERLSCQTRCSGDVSCEVPDESAERQQRAQRAKDGFKQKLVDRSKARR